MDFKLVVCPKCKNKTILWFCTSGTTCSCGMKLLEDTEENRKDEQKRNAEFADCFSGSYEEFKRNLKQIENKWSKETLFVRFEVVTISDERLLEAINDG